MQRDGCSELAASGCRQRPSSAGDLSASALPAGAVPRRQALPRRSGPFPSGQLFILRRFFGAQETGVNADG
eukprot:3486489-Pyramimonas_sp.AAC.1